MATEAGATDGLHQTTTGAGTRGPDHHWAAVTVTACVVPGTGNPELAAALAAHLGVVPVACRVERFPDGELHVGLDDVRGEDVYVVQPTGPPVDEHLVELLLLVDACRRGGATRVTAVVPYFGYARQDRRLEEAEAVGARVCAASLAAAGADRLVVVDPHTVALEALAPMPVEMLTAVPVLAAALGDVVDPEAVIVAPDLGAVKLAEGYARLLHRDIAVVRKVRLSGAEVQARAIVGDVASRPSVIVDDMISTGATVEAAVEVLRSQAGATDVTVAATHGVCVGGAARRIGALGVRRLLLTDTVATPGVRSELEAPELHVCTVAPLLADAIDRLHRNASLGTLRLRR